MKDTQILNHAMIQHPLYGDNQRRFYLVEFSFNWRVGNVVYTSNLDAEARKSLYDRVSTILLSQREKKIIPNIIWILYNFRYEKNILGIYYFFLLIYLHTFFLGFLFIANSYKCKIRNTTRVKIQVL